MMSTSRTTLRWTLFASVFLLCGVLVGLAQLQLAFLRSAPRQAAAEPLAHPGAMTVAIRPDGGTLASIDGYGRARTWDLKSGRAGSPVQVGPVRRDSAAQVDTDSHGRLVSFNRQRMQLVRWEDRPVVFPEPRLGWGGPSACGSFVLGMEGDSIRVFNSRNGKEVGRKRIGPMIGYTTEVDPTGRYVAWAQSAGVFLAPLGGGAIRRLWRGPWSGDLPWVEFSPDGRYLGVLGSVQTRRSLRIWETASGKELPPLPVAPDPHATFHWSPDSHQVALSIRVNRRYPVGWLGFRAADETVNVLQVWDLTTRRPQGDHSDPHRVRGHFERILDWAWSPDGTRLASLDEAGRLAVWNVRSGILERFLRP